MSNDVIGYLVRKKSVSSRKVVKKMLEDICHGKFVIEVRLYLPTLRLSDFVIK